ncbi:MAG: arginine--tRNA ligase, partial [Clostridia bacterium]
MDYKKQIAALIKIEGVTAQDIEELITKPKEVSNGDYCLPCFRFSKSLRKSPMAIADELLQNIQIGGIIERVESVAGYLNFKLNREQ